MTILEADKFLDQAEQGVIIDVRSPGEYAKGHIPSAESMPLFSDEERAEIGTLYVRTSREVAIERGLEIVGPKMAGFVRRAKELSDGKPIFLYCWRGGMRSGSMAWLLSTAGLKVSLLKGGYKGYRRSFEAHVKRLSSAFVLLSGYTGSGKTEILEHMSTIGEQVVDLEGLANHRGSAFGAFGLDPQPTTEHYQNLIHDKIRGMSSDSPIWIEGESLQVGRVYIPVSFFSGMDVADIINYNVPREVRVKHLVEVYGRFDKQMYVEAFDKIRKRLGGDMADLAKGSVEQGDLAHAADIALNYYDKGYAMSSSKRKGRLLVVEYVEGDYGVNATNIIEKYREWKK